MTLAICKSQSAPHKFYVVRQISQGISFEDPEVIGGPFASIEEARFVIENRLRSPKTQTGKLHDCVRYME